MSNLGEINLACYHLKSCLSDSANADQLQAIITVNEKGVLQSHRQHICFIFGLRVCFISVRLLCHNKTQYLIGSVA